MELVNYRDTWAEISLDAIRGNIQAFKQHIQSNSKLMAVVKADGYGHGAVEIARVAIESGVDYLAVALLEEAIQLREAGINHPLLVLGYTKPEGAAKAIEYNVTLTVFTEEVIDAIAEAANKLNKTAKIHLKIDTGMTRVGVRSKEAALDLMRKIPESGVEVEGIFTHFADADNPESSYTKGQFESFVETAAFLEKNGFLIPIKHCCNSAATIAYPEMHLDMCRVGVSLYGLYPGSHLKEEISLTQAMSFKSKPVYIKEVEQDRAISYGCSYKTDRKSVIATLGIGYADGLNRRLSSRADVTVRGKRAPIIGRICMDQTMIDVTDIDYVTKDDVFTIFGDSKEGFISLDEVAEILDTIHYEIVCLVGKRVPRIYTEESSK